MDLNDKFHLYFIFDLTPFPLKSRDRRSPVRGGNERDPVVDGRQRRLTTSAPILTPSLTFSANSRSPPLGNRYYSLHSQSAVYKQEAA